MIREQSNGKATASGFLWLLAQGATGRVVNFGSQLILAKLLLPEAFGEIGVALAVANLVSVAVVFGIDDILLQRLAKMKYWFAPSFWSSAAFGLIGAIIIVASAPWLTAAYSQNNLSGLLTILAVTLVLNSLSVVPTVRLRADFRFRFLAVYASLEIIAIHTLTIILAANNFGAYSFVAPLPLAAIVKLVVYWTKIPSRVIGNYRKRQIAYILYSGSQALGTKLVNQAINQGDYIILGLLASSSEVGMYFFAFRLASQPIRKLAGNLTSALLPSLARLGSNPTHQGATAFKASRMLLYICTPFCLMQAAMAEPLLHLLFGTRWEGSIILVQILSVGLIGDAISWVTSALLISKREFRRDFLFALTLAPFFFGFAYVGAYYGSSVGLSIGVSVFFTCVKPLASWIVFREFVSIKEFLRGYALPVIISLTAVGSPLMALEICIPKEATVVRTITIMIVSPICYLILMRITARKTLQDITNIFPKGARLFAKIL